MPRQQGRRCCIQVSIRAHIRYESLYPEPPEEEYARTVPGCDRTDVNHVSLIANNGRCWRDCHVDSSPGGDLLSRLLTGSKLWFFPTGRRKINILRGVQNTGDYKVIVRSLPSIMLEDIKHNKDIRFVCNIREMRFRSRSNRARTFVWAWINLAKDDGIRGFRWPIWDCSEGGRP